MRRQLLPALFLCSLLSCQKKDNSPTIDFGAGEGISYRDNINRPAGPGDPTDWTSDATWNAQELALFSELSFDLNGPQQPALIGVGYAFPNPAPGGQASWALQTQRGPSGGVASYTFRAVIVNRKYQVLERLGPRELILSAGFAFDYNKMGLPNKETARLYYVVYNNDGLVYKGHGDVRNGQ